MPRTTPRSSRPPQPPAGVAITLSKEERDALRDSIAGKLAHLAKAHATLATCDELSAHRIICEHRDYLRLLDDLGWAAKDRRLVFPITMPARPLGRTLAHLAKDDPAAAAVCAALLKRLP